MSQAPKHSLTADFAEFELLLDGDIDEPLLYDKIPIEPSECLGVFDATPVKSSGSLIVSNELHKLFLLFFYSYFKSRRSFDNHFKILLKKKQTNI